MAQLPDYHSPASNHEFAATFGYPWKRLLCRFADGARDNMALLKTVCAGRLEARLGFASHQFRVASGIPYCRERPGA